jgi:hypothetical protein
VRTLLLRESESAVVALLRAVTRRARREDALRAAAWGALGASVTRVVLLLLAVPDSLTAIAALAIAAAGVAGVLWRRRSRWTLGAAAERVERQYPSSRNLIVTAEELLTRPAHVQPWMRTRVLDAADAFAHGVRPAAVAPLRRIGTLSVVAVVAAGVVVVTGVPERLAARVRDSRRKPAGASADARRTALPTLAVTVRPPAYTGESERVFANPDRLTIVQGSEVRLSLSGAGQWRVRYGTQTVPVQSDGTQARAKLIPTESGYFALESSTSSDGRRLLPVTIEPDRAPIIKIDRPGKDLLLPDARGTIAVRAIASDDYGLRALDLRYTKVSGTGEQFEFVEGSLPLEVDRNSGRAWNAHGVFSLTALRLEPGDSLVYRAVAHDARPGDTGMAASDTYFIEVVGPGQVALPGFELPPDQQRYALSQQMIVLKLQRLRAKEPSLSREALEQETGAIAAEQRAVRANFIFLLGGHVEDEEEEAEQSSEIQEGRLRNNARREIEGAIKFMGETEQALIAVSPARALPPAKAAVDALQRAFGRNRYFVRTLAARSRIDPSRRLHGELDTASDWTRQLPATEPDERIRAARAILARLFDTLGRDRSLASSDATVAALAEEALAVDPTSPEWQEISTHLAALRAAVAAQKPNDEIRRPLQAAVTALIAVSRKGAIADSEGVHGLESLRGAWAGEGDRR